MEKFDWLHHMEVHKVKEYDRVELIVEKERYTKHNKKQTKLCAATLGNDAGIIGAAFLD